MLQKAGKPIVGHNMMFDILFTYSKFIGPLPPTYKQFAKLWTQLFCGGTYDTKCLSKHIISLAQDAKDRIFQKT